MERLTLGAAVRTLKEAGFVAGGTDSRALMNSDVHATAKIAYNADREVEIRWSGRSFDTRTYAYTQAWQLDADIENALGRE